MKNHWMKRISILLAALFLLFALPVSAMAEKGSGIKTGISGSAAKATWSNIPREKATPSNAEKYFPDSDYAEPDTSKPEKGGSSRAEGIKTGENTLPQAAPAVTAPAPAVLPAAVPITKEDLAGTWTIDDVTTYRFGKDGDGVLILPAHKYSFSYTIKEDELVLKFSSDKIKKAVFAFSLEGDTLTLVKKENAGIAEFVLERADD